MYWIPHGTFLELENLGLKKEIDSLSNRILFHLFLTGEKYYIVDNGYVTRSSDRFLSSKFYTFNFGERYLSIKIYLFDQNKCGIENHTHEKKFNLSIMEARLLEKVFRAFYPNRYYEIEIHDQRKETIEIEIQKITECITKEQQAAEIKISILRDKQRNLEKELSEEQNVG